MAQDADQSLPALLRSLRGEMSRSRLSRATVAYDGVGVSEETIKALEAGKWGATPETLRAIAHGLGIEPERFPQYRLALVRRLLDEREVGVEQALSNLARLQGATSATARPADDLGAALVAIYEEHGGGAPADDADAETTDKATRGEGSPARSDPPADPSSERSDDRPGRAAHAAERQ